MNHADHVRLLKDGIPAQGGVWADFGSGTGAFTLALADLIGPSGEIYSIDKDAGALREQESVMRTRFPSLKVHSIHADFSHPIDLPPLDGIVMANALHFFRHSAKDHVLTLVRDYLCDGGRFILVEYNVDQGNLWVPYPMTFTTWQKIAASVGFTSTKLLATTPSRFLHEIYSALAIKIEKGKS